MNEKKCKNCYFFRVICIGGQKPLKICTNIINKICNEYGEWALIVNDDDNCDEFKKKNKSNK